jgi:hypothetical protein
MCHPLIGTLELLVLKQRDNSHLSEPITVGLYDPPGRFWIGVKYRGFSGFPFATPIPSPVDLADFVSGHWLMWYPSILCGQRCWSASGK